MENSYYYSVIQALALDHLSERAKIFLDQHGDTVIAELPEVIQPEIDSLIEFLMVASPPTKTFSSEQDTLAYYGLTPLYIRDSFVLLTAEQEANQKITNLKKRK